MMQRYFCKKNRKEIEKHEEANYIIAPKQVYAGTGCASLDLQYKISSHIDGTRVENIFSNL